MNPILNELRDLIADKHARRCRENKATFMEARRLCRARAAVRAILHQPIDPSQWHRAFPPLYKDS